MKRTLNLTILAVLVFGANCAWANGPFPSPLVDGTYGPVGSVTPNSSSGEFEIYNAVNLLLNTNYSNNAQIDGLEVTGNTSTWQQNNTSGYTVIGLGADNSNTFEVYNTATPSTLISPIGTSFSGDASTGNGTMGSPYIGSTAAVFPSGTQFGLALNTVGESNITGTNSTPPGGITWYSDPSLNSDSMDHMLVYSLSSLTGTQVYIYDPNTGTEQAVTLNDPFLVTFEDLPLNANGANSDLDYNDFMVLVNGVAPGMAAPEPVTVALFGFSLMAMAAAFALRRKFAFLK